MNRPGLASWSVALPPLGLVALVGGVAGLGAAGVTIAALILTGTVIAAVHHAEIVAHKVGEPFGTLVLAVAVTVIEVSLIVSLMLSDPVGGPTLARDTVFAAIMIILNGIVGLCLLIGGLRHHEQRFVLRGVSAALATLMAMAVLTLVLPNFTSTTPGPTYSASQLVFVALASLALYGVFVTVQTVTHRDYFLPDGDTPLAPDTHVDPPEARVAWIAFGLLIVALAVVVFLAKSLAPTLEAAVVGAQLPLTVVGVAIAALVLAPESLAAVRAARRNRLQTSLNLALGSALATIGLTIPSVAAVSLLLDLPLGLGLDAKGITLLALSFGVAVLSLGTGRTTVLQGAVHLVILGAYIVTTLVP